MASPEFDELEQMAAVATYCKAARLLQTARPPEVGLDLLDPAPKQCKVRPSRRWGVRPLSETGI
jgi:hypothetical protein